MGWNCLIRFTYAKGLDLLYKNIQFVSDIWDSEQQNILTWNRVQKKFNLTSTEACDWEELMNKISGQWHHLLDTNWTPPTRPLDWVLVDDEEDLVFIVQCIIDFAQPCMKLHQLFLQLPAQCFTVGTHSQCLREWEMTGIFHKVKIVHTNRGPKNMVKMKM